jgi:hypothetical protein
MTISFSRRNLLRTAATGGAALAVAATARPSDAQAPARSPNIVFILADDMGYADVSCYGRRDLLTPNIDRIAAQGTRFVHPGLCQLSGLHCLAGGDHYRSLPNTPAGGLGGANWARYATRNRPSDVIHHVVLGPGGVTAGHERLAVGNSSSRCADRCCQDGMVSGRARRLS